MTANEADQIILDAELDLLTLPPLPAAVSHRRHVANLQAIRRDADKLSREIEREITLNRRFLYVVTFALAFCIGVLLFA